MTVVLAYALACSLFAGRMRYRVSILPCVFILAGLGASALLAALRSRRAGSLRPVPEPPPLQPVPGRAHGERLDGSQGMRHDTPRRQSQQLETSKRQQ